MDYLFRHLADVSNFFEKVLTDAVLMSTSGRQTVGGGASFDIGRRAVLASTYVPVFWKLTRVGLRAFCQMKRSPYVLILRSVRQRSRRV